MGSLVEKYFSKVLRCTLNYGLRGQSYFWIWLHCSHGTGFKAWKMWEKWAFTKVKENYRGQAMCGGFGFPERPCMKLWRWILNWNGDSRVLAMTDLRTFIEERHRHRVKPPEEVLFAQQGAELERQGYSRALDPKWFHHKPKGPDRELQNLLWALLAFSFALVWCFLAYTFIAPFWNGNLDSVHCILEICNLFYDAIVGITVERVPQVSKETMDPGSVEICKEDEDLWS